MEEGHWDAQRASSRAPRPAEEGQVITDIPENCLMKSGQILGLDLIVLYLVFMDCATVFKSPADNARSSLPTPGLDHSH